ncbi:cysteine hydrolase family protein [Sphingomonas sp. ID0503]|uniref:cysteine hydrolase family protein n=1 Tax=Sphingomonas sp. ID0503 TaxID=3399691 RepID=UPI003AFA44F6
MSDTENNAPGKTALLLIDFINEMKFRGAEAMLPAAEAAAEAAARLRATADEAGVPVIYVNDNFDEWHSNRELLVERCLDGPGRNMVSAVKPATKDLFVIKPQFSGFYATNLPVLLPRLGVSRLILTGIAADICVLFTAADAHMRQYDLWVPRDTVAAGDAERTRWALEIMEQSMGARTDATDALSLADWIAEA